MRLVVPALLFALASTAACGDPESEPSGPSGPTACEVGPGIVGQSIATLKASAPACTADADCVLIDTDVDCPSFSTAACGRTAMHRDVAPKWSSSEVCREIAAAVTPSKYTCEQECVSIEVKPACTSGVCTEVPAHE